VLVEDGGGGRGAATAGAEVADADQAVEVADAPRGLHLDAIRACLPHEGQVVLGRAAVVVRAVGLLDEAVARRGLDPVGPGLLADLAEAGLELVRGKPRASLG